MKVPQIKSFTEKLIWICLFLILIYLAFTAAYAHFSTEPLKLSIVREMLESSLLSIIITTGGAILLDFEIRLHESGK